ncbi:hypothetical protein VFPPC_16743 [Pochonia chlamydosporia 170]|uniref:Uncharacterized protein n=1 Tax=Pochonia chlamydosporia 170 TaxID=1380566 RepID=A0A179F575_METCM|nr:hypothetical protein VFPPC_16743 [Pochonia chlamydosporia 170]OAQ60577.1 hypothetical protein VFPPC_16743 [Pochonia chlamydosporia 170]
MGKMTSYLLKSQHSTAICLFLRPSRTFYNFAMPALVGNRNPSSTAKIQTLYTFSKYSIVQCTVFLQCEPLPVHSPRKTAHSPSCTGAQKPHAPLTYRHQILTYIILVKNTVSIPLDSIGVRQGPDGMLVFIR